MTGQFVELWGVIKSTTGRETVDRLFKAEYTDRKFDGVSIAYDVKWLQQYYH